MTSAPERSDYLPERVESASGVPTYLLDWSGHQPVLTHQETFDELRQPS